HGRIRPPDGLAPDSRLPAPPAAGEHFAGVADARRGSPSLPFPSLFQAGAGAAIFRARIRALSPAACAAGFPASPDRLRGSAARKLSKRMAFAVLSSAVSYERHQAPQMRANARPHSSGLQFHDGHRISEPRQRARAAMSEGADVKADIRAVRDFWNRMP